MTATAVATGDRIPYTPSGADVAAEDVVVLASLVGIATEPIADGELGSLAIEGIFNMTKKAGDAMPAGTVVYWDATPGEVTVTSTSNTLLGKVAETVADAAVLVNVKLTP